MNGNVKNFVKILLFGLILSMGLMAWSLFESLPSQVVQAAQATPPPPPKVEVVVDSLQVRSCPSEECDVVGTVPRGTQVEFLGCMADGNWCQVSLLDGQSGWCTDVSLRHLAEVVPVLEADKGKIAFLSDRDREPGLADIYLMNLDGSGLIRVTTGLKLASAMANSLFDLEDHFAWSPVQQKFFYANNSGELYSVNADGSGETLVTEGIGRFDLSPDGQYIAFELIPAFPSSEIAIMNINGTDKTILTDKNTRQILGLAPDSISLAPTWSPDGSQIAFYIGGSLAVMNPDGTDPVPLTPPFSTMEPYIWSPNGRHIAFKNPDRPGFDQVDVQERSISKFIEQGLGPAWSPDGSKIAFYKSGPSGIPPNGPPPQPDISQGEWQIWVMNADGSGLTQLTFAGHNCCPVWVTDTTSEQAGGTGLISTASDGTQGTSGGFPVEPLWHPGPSISVDGRYVAFSSFANNLVAGDTNNWQDVFMHDRQTGQTHLVSMAAGGTQGNGWSIRPTISADGRYVAFDSSANNLIASDTNASCNKNGYPGSSQAGIVLNCADVFIYDRQLAEISLASVASNGSQGNGGSGPAAISADGRYVAFWSKANNLVAGDTNDTDDVFVHDWQTGQTTRVSVASNGSQGNGFAQRSFVPWAGPPAISADGRYVAFWSDADNLVDDDTNAIDDVFVHDQQTEQTQRVSVASNGSQGNGPSGWPSISADGRYVAFASEADNLVDNDTNQTWDIFIYDRETGQTQRVSVAADGSQGNGASGPAAISADGRYVAFSSEASNLVDNDTNQTWDVFIHDVQTGSTSRVSVAVDASSGDGSSFSPTISAGGGYVAFWSNATNLVEGDVNGEADVFVLDQSSETPLSSEGVILFLSSRDHDPDPQTAASPTGPAQNRTVELYVMRPDGSDQTRLTDGNRDWWNGNASITPYHIPNHVVINGRYLFDLTAGQVVNELTLEFPNTTSDIPFTAQAPIWTSEGEIIFYGNKWDERLSIYYLDNIQGEPQKLTDPPENAWGDGFPTLSPDGEWIIFMRNWFDEAQDGLWLMRPDGSDARRIIAGKEGTPRRAFWSPDGSKLAYEGPKPNATIFSFELWVAEADGSNPRQLTSFPEDSRGALEPKWSPDGKRIIFQDGFDKGQIFIIDADGGELQQLTTIGDANLAPLWLPLSFDEIVSEEIVSDTLTSASPTPTPTLTPTPTPAPAVARTYQLAYSKWDGGFHNVYIGDTNGQSERLIIKRAAGPSWSADGQRLFFLGQQGVNQQFAPDGRLDCDFGTISDGIVALDIPPGSGDICSVYYGAWQCERKQIDVQSPPGDVCEQDGYQVFQNLDWKEGTARWANVAPDGSAVAYDAKPGGAYRVYFRSILDNAQYHFELDGEQADWSPDSQRLVYRSGRDNRQGLWISNRDDTGHVNITVNGSDSFPAWSPDGRTIAFSREEGGNVDIYTVNVDGSNLRRLTDAPGQDTLPTYTPSGEIIFRSARTGSWGIWKMNGDGSNQQEIVPNAGVGPDWAYSKMDVLP